MSSATTTNNTPGGNAGPSVNTYDQNNGGGASTGTTDTGGAKGTDQQLPLLRIVPQQYELLQFDRVARPDPQMQLFRNELFLLR